METLKVDMYVSFRSTFRSFDDGGGSDMLSTLGGNAMVPSHCPDIRLDGPGKSRTLVAAWDPIGRAKFEFEFSPAGAIG